MNPYLLAACVLGAIGVAVIAGFAVLRLRKNAKPADLSPKSYDSEAVDNAAWVILGAAEALERSHAVPSPDSPVALESAEQLKRLAAALFTTNIEIVTGQRIGQPEGRIR